VLERGAYRLGALSNRLGFLRSRVRLRHLVEREADRKRGIEPSGQLPELLLLELVGFLALAQCKPQVRVLARRGRLRGPRRSASKPLFSIRRRRHRHARRFVRALLGLASFGRGDLGRARSIRLRCPLGRGIVNQRRIIPRYLDADLSLVLSCARARLPEQPVRGRALAVEARHLVLLRADHSLTSKLCCCLLRLPESVSTGLRNAAPGSGFQAVTRLLILLLMPVLVAFRGIGPVWPVPSVVSSAGRQGLVWPLLEVVLQSGELLCPLPAILPELELCGELPPGGQLLRFVFPILVVQVCLREIGRQRDVRLKLLLVHGCVALRSSSLRVLSLQATQRPHDVV